MNRPIVLALPAITALAVAGIIVLSVLGDPIPDVLSAIALGGLTGAAGATVPQGAGLTVQVKPRHRDAGDPDVVGHVVEVPQ